MKSLILDDEEVQELLRNGTITLNRPIKKGHK